MSHLVVCFYIFPFEFTSPSPVYLASTKWIWVALSIDLKKEVTSCQDSVPMRREVWSTSRSCFQNEAGLYTRCPFSNDVGLDTRCKLPDDVGLHTSQVESSTVRVLVALVKAERQRATAVENVAEFLKK